MSMSHSLVLGLCSALLVWPVLGDYWEDRTRFLDTEQDMYLGSDLELNAKEVRVNDVLVAMKSVEYLDAFQTINTTFPPARHFFEAKSDIEKSAVFKFIQKMPKGGALHGHDFALVSTDYLVKNLTYRPNLYACVEEASVVFKLHFFATPDDSCNWTLVSEMRRLAEDVDTFDKWLETKMSLVVPNPQEIYPDIDAVWSKFQSLFGVVIGLLTYRPVFEDYFHQFLTEFHDDNVMYIEFRAGIVGLYNLDGTILSTVETATLMSNIVNSFVANNPDFWGGKVIYGPSRRVDNTTIKDYLAEYKLMKEALPDFIAGFDLVGQEDKGETIQSFVDELLQFRDEGAKFFFHAGETNWEGTTDLNLIDAILLNTTRIGHGFALNKHPLALQLIKERGIAIEVNPISNQVLQLVDDLRNHPASSLMAGNYPVVIGSDDPSFWGAKGLSYDMYAAFMGLGGLRADLKTLKQLSLNSLQYSALESIQKENAVIAWELQWDKFLDLIISEMPKKTPTKLKPTPKLRLINIINPKKHLDQPIRVDLIG